MEEGSHGPGAPSGYPLRDFYADFHVAEGSLITGQNQGARPMTADPMPRVLAKRTTSEWGMP
jgi:hypothetical protein